MALRSATLLRLSARAGSAAEEYLPRKWAAMSSPVMASTLSAATGAQSVCTIPSRPAAISTVSNAVTGRVP